MKSVYQLQSLVQYRYGCEEREPEGRTTPKTVGNVWKTNSAHLSSPGPSTESSTSGLCQLDPSYSHVLPSLPQTGPSQEMVYTLTDLVVV